MSKKEQRQSERKGRIAVLQPHVPHYREEFFAKLDTASGGADIYVYERQQAVQRQGFSRGATPVTHLPALSLRGVIMYNPLPLLKGHDVMVLMLHFAHLTTWLLLLTRFIHRRKIILWGQGISVKRYLKEERKADWRLRLMASMADGLWLYMDKESSQWRKILPRKPIVALGNTLTGVSEMVAYEPPTAIDRLKEKYGISQPRVVIYCARFNHSYRRADILVDIIRHSDSAATAFIIIGDGVEKPDFMPFDNVHDFGALYDTAVKRELFAIADVYLQPGWVGLSIVEAMAYGKPVFTMHRSQTVKQCVEYSYIEPGVNGMLFDTAEECAQAIANMPLEQLKSMGNNARTLVSQHLTVDNMTANAMTVVDVLRH